MSFKLLDPTLDVVFKLLLLRNNELLRDMIEAVILWFKTSLLETPRFHSVFHVAETHSHEVFSPELEFHVLELPKLALATPDPEAKLERWARFLRAANAEEFEELAREDATMNTAKKALEDLSMDPKARRLASEREMAVVMHRHLMAASREAGREEGEAKGRAEALRETLTRLLNRRFGPLPSWAQEQVAQARNERLEGLIDAVLDGPTLESILNVGDQRR